MEADHDNMSLRVASFSCYLDTAKENLVQRVSAQETPIPLNSPAKTSSSRNPTKPPLTIKFSKPKDHHHQSQDYSLKNLRVDSFSFLNSAADNNFVFEVPGPVQDPTTAFTFTHETPKDGEISVFGADKYFNTKFEVQNHHNKVLKQKYTEDEGPNVNIPLRIGAKSATTPSLCSEESSWNSQTALFTNNVQRVNIESQNNPNKNTRKSFFPGFACGRPCFDKKSVHISEIASRTGSERIIKDIIPPTSLPNHRSDRTIDESRPSIEVFGSSGPKSDHNHSIVAANMERKLSILTWDAIPKRQNSNLPTSTAGSSTIICDDMASEASSDLFEIENISGSVFPLLSPEPGDDTSTCMSPTSNYAPSEASIQWSVVTASAAADYSSVLSDYNEETSVSAVGDAVMRNNIGKGGKKVEKGHGGGILGCKSQKAVDVAENHKTFGESQPGRGRMKDLDILQYPSIH